MDCNWDWDYTTRIDDSGSRNNVGDNNHKNGNNDNNDIDNDNNNGNDENNKNNDCSTEERSVWNVKNVLQSFTNMVCYNNEAFSDA